MKIFRKAVISLLCILLLSAGVGFFGQPVKADPPRFTPTNTAPVQVGMGEQFEDENTYKGGEIEEDNVTSGTKALVKVSNWEQECGNLIDAWNIAVYMALHSRSPVGIKLFDDFKAFTKSGTYNHAGNKYKYNAYDFGVNFSETDLCNTLYMPVRNVEPNAFRYGSLCVPKGTDITLDLNGHVINRYEGNKQREDGEVIHVEAGGTLTVVDSNPEADNGIVKGGMIMGGSSGDGAGGVHVKGTLNWKDGTIYACNTDKHGGAIYVSSRGKLNMTGGKILECATFDSEDECHGGAIYITENSQCSLSDCTIDKCSSEDDGGAIYLQSGSLSMNHTEINLCTSKDEGGAVYAAGGTLDFQNSIIYANRTNDGHFGGGIYLDSSSSHRFTGCSFQSNYAGKGAGVLINKGWSTFTNCEFVYNSEASEGAGVYVKGGQADFVECEFSMNSVSGNGGGLYVLSEEGVRLADCKFYGNKAKNQGGAIYLKGDRIVFSGTDITYNTAENDGGAIYVNKSSDLNLQGYCVIKDNTSVSKKTPNIALEDSSNGTAYLYTGSLEPGSCIHIGTTDSGWNKVTKDSYLSQYQFSNYIVADNAEAKLENTQLKKVPFIASVFDKNVNVWIMAAGGVLVIAAIAAGVVIRKKKAKAGDK